MIRLKIPVIVEGRYDKARLSRLIDGVILTTEGFGVFRSEEKRALIRKLGQGGVILLCDSDGGGRLIRSHLRGMLNGIPVYDLYTPQIPGKERRKKEHSKAGFLGVEGVPDEILVNLFEQFAAAHPELTEEGSSESAQPKKPLTTADLYAHGLTGSPDSAARRDALCEKIGLPHGMNARGLLAALNLLGGTEETMGDF